MYNVYNLEVNGSSIDSYGIEEIIKKFKTFLLLKKISPGTIRSYLSDVRHFFAWLESFLKSTHLPSSNFLLLLKHLNQDVLNAYKNSLISNNAPQKTINRRFSSLRKFGAFSQDQGWSVSSEQDQRENAFDTLKNIPEEGRPFPETENHLEEFKVHLWKKNRSKATLKNYLNDIKQFIEWQNSHRLEENLK